MTSTTPIFKTNKMEKARLEIIKILLDIYDDGVKQKKTNIESRYCLIKDILLKQLNTQRHER